MALPLTRPRQTRGLVASAASYSSARKSLDSAYVKRKTMPWQRRALAYLDMVPELSFSSRFYSKMLRPLRIYPGMLLPDGSIEPIREGLPVEMLNRLKSKDGTMKPILGNYGRLMFATGEGNMLGLNIDTDDEYWSFVWNEEVSVEMNNGKVKEILHKPMGNGGEIKKYTPSQARVYRMWTPHPRTSGEADSPMRSVLEIAEELIALTAAVRSTATSRTVAGILLMPTEMAPVPAEYTGDEDEESDPFVDEMLQHLESQIEDAGSAAASAPWVLWGAYELIDRIRMVQLHDPQTDYMERDLRKEAVERMARGMDFPAEYLMGLSGTNHWCQDGQHTQVMARSRGWIGHHDLSVGDVILTLNHETGESEWQPVTDIYRAEVEGEIMHRMESKSHSSLSTSGHRWPIIKVGRKVSGSRRRWTTSAEGFATTDRIPVAARLEESAGQPQNYDDDFVRLVVSYTADGMHQKHDNIRIVKFQEREIIELRRILTSVFGEDGFRENDHHTHTADGRAFILRQQEALRVFAVCGEEKAVRLDFVDGLTLAQCQIFLDSCVEIGDGIVVNGAYTLYQVESSRLDAFAYAAHLCGHKVTTGKRNQQTGFGTEPLSWVRWSIGRDTFSPHECEQSLEAYTGTIWCPVTKNGTWLARRNGKAFFTGNSAKQILDDMWRSHGIGVADQFTGDVNDAYLRPGLRDAEYPGWEDVVVIYDESGVVVPADQSKDADAAHDRGEIGGTGYRALKNIPEIYKQTKEEHEEWLAVKLRDEALLGVENPSTSPPNPSDGPPPPGPEGDSGRKTRVVSAALELGAAEMALARCRELAGIRIKQKEKTCPEFFVGTSNEPTGSLAAVIGPDILDRISLTAWDLVRGGADSMKVVLKSWGYTVEASESISDMVESYAARTLFKSGHPTLPSGFAAQFERAKEASDVND